MKPPPRLNYSYHKSTNHCSEPWINLALLHRTVVVTPTIFPGTFPPWNSADHVPKKVTPKTFHHGTPVKTAKCSKHQKLGTYKTQWNRSHTHLERGTFLIIFQMGLHLRTAWNAAFTTLNISESKLAFLPDYHLSFRWKNAITCGPLQVTNLRTNAQTQQQDHSYLVPLARAPTRLPPAAAAALAAPSSTKHSDVHIPKNSFWNEARTRSERGANEVRTRSEGDPHVPRTNTLLPILLKKHAKAHKHKPCEREQLECYFVKHSWASLASGNADNRWPKGENGTWMYHCKCSHKDVSSKPFCKHVQYSISWF